MRKVNTNKIEEESWESPKGKFGGSGKQVSAALGSDPLSTDVRKRHPFAIENARIPAGKVNWPHHFHSAQWEFYHVISGKGQVRHAEGTTEIVAGDAFLFEPGQAHQIINDGSEDLVLYVVADNPIDESLYYPDSDKWMVPSLDDKLIRSEGLEYYDSEE
jgi:Uncharacterized conserved protein, contains double-stranded beta-helix domain